MPEATKLSSVVTDFTELQPLNSVLKIKNKFGSDLNSFDFQQIKYSEAKKLLKEVDIKKAVGVDTIPPKLIKIGADIITETLTFQCSRRTQKLRKFCLQYGLLK